MTRTRTLFHTHLRAERKGVTAGHSLQAEAEEREGRHTRRPRSQAVKVRRAKKWGAKNSALSTCRRLRNFSNFKPRRLRGALCAGEALLEASVRRLFQTRVPLRYAPTRVWRAMKFKVLLRKRGGARARARGMRHPYNVIENTYGALGTNEAPL